MIHACDALRGSLVRSEASLAWTREDWLLLATDHREAFGTGERLPDRLQGRTLRIGPTLCRRLAALDAPTRERELGARRRAALLGRRDRIVRESRWGAVG